MKVLVTFAAVMCFAALPAYSADGQLSQSSLARLGLSGMTPISDGQGLEVRGMGMMQAMGMDNGYGNNQHDHDMYDDGHKHDMYGKDHDKDHKDHNKDHNKDHGDKHHEHEHQHEHQHNHGQNHFDCHFGSKSHPNMNFGNICSHVHGCKG